MKGYLHELFTRPSCHDCAFKSFRSGSDITLADFWGIEKILPDYKSDEGVSLVMKNTTKGNEALTLVMKGHGMNEVDYNNAISENRALIHSEQPHPERTYFFQHIGELPFVVLVNECLKLRQITRIKLLLKAYLRKFGIK